MLFLKGKENNRKYKIRGESMKVVLTFLIVICVVLIAASLFGNYEYKEFSEDQKEARNFNERMYGKRKFEKVMVTRKYIESDLIFDDYILVTSMGEYEVSWEKYRKTKVGDNVEACERYIKHD